MSQEEKTPLQAAANRLWHIYFDNCPGVHPFVSCIGTAEKGEHNPIAMIHVYLVRKPMAHEGKIPKIWDGFPVVSHVTGRMSIG